MPKRNLGKMDMNQSWCGEGLKEGVRREVENAAFWRVSSEDFGFACSAPGSNDEPATSNEADDDDDDDSSCSDMSGQPTPLPLSGRFPSAVPFQRLHFPRDSGCYDADAGSSGGRHWSSSHRHHRYHQHPCRSSANNLDAIQLDECARRGGHEPPPAPAPHDSADYMPNIPVASASPTSVDSYVVARGKVVSVEPCPRPRAARAAPRQAAAAHRREANWPPQPANAVEAKPSVGNEYLKRLLTESDKEEDRNGGGPAVNGEHSGEGAESPGKATDVGLECESGSHSGTGAPDAGDPGASSGAGVGASTGAGGGGGTALSEKSSDSGVSSSSISSSQPVAREPPKNSRKSSAPAVPSSGIPIVDLTPARCQFRVQK